LYESSVARKTFHGDGLRQPRRQWLLTGK